MVESITVNNLENQDVEVINNSPLQMIGKGRQGAVFHYTDDVCVKVFGNEEDCEREYEALSMGQHTGLFPRVYDHGPLFIVMETIKGIDLREYLQSHPLTEELSAKLIEMLIIFKEIGYERIDHHKRQIYLQADGSLRVIDVARTIWRDRVYPYPRKLLTSLGETHRETFLSHVKAFSPELLEEWSYYMRMEELAKEIYPLLLESGKTKKVVKDLSSRLLTKDEKENASNLANLMHKVFKEEWVKTMLARGQNPDEVMQKIDEHWDALEQQQQQQQQQQQPVAEESNKRLEKIDFSEIQRIINGFNKPDKKEKDDKKKKEDKKKFEKASPAEKSKMLRQELTSILMQKIMDNSKKGKK
jgi:predicted Ser/Thr protein kinase